MTDRAKQMQEADLTALSGCDRISEAYDAIRALPLSPQPALDAEVADMVATLRGTFCRDPAAYTAMCAAANLIERLAREKVEAEADLTAEREMHLETQEAMRAFMADLDVQKAEVARLRDGHLQIVREFGDTPNGHRAAEISRAALAEIKGESHE